MAYGLRATTQNLINDWASGKEGKQLTWSGTTIIMTTTTNVKTISKGSKI